VTGGAAGTDGSGAWLNTGEATFKGSRARGPKASTSPWSEAGPRSEGGRLPPSERLDRPDASLRMSISMRPIERVEAVAPDCRLLAEKKEFPLISDLSSSSVSLDSRRPDLRRPACAPFLGGVGGVGRGLSHEAPGGPGGGGSRSPHSFGTERATSSVV